jgi:hypothetical protein
MRVRVIERYVDAGIYRDEAKDRTDELLSRLGEA